MNDASLRAARVLVPVTPTRTDFADRLERAGAHVARAEFIMIAPTRDPEQLEQAVAAWNQGQYNWLVLTSRNGVNAVVAAAGPRGLSGGDYLGHIAAVGAGTAQQCESAGLRVSLVPQVRWDARSLVDDFPTGQGRVLAPLGNLASPVLRDGLAAKGWDVDVVEAYRTVDGAGIEPHVRDELASGGFDAVVLTSGSVAQRFADAVPRLGSRTRVVAIGHTTSAAARERGIAVHAVAERASYDGIMACLTDVLTTRSEVSS